MQLCNNSSILPIDRFNDALCMRTRDATGALAVLCSDVDVSWLHDYHSYALVALAVTDHFRHLTVGDFPMHGVNCMSVVISLLVPLTSHSGN